MNVVECDVPSGSLLSREIIQQAYFRDSYGVPLRCKDLAIVDVFRSIFAHRPLWMKLLLIVRNRIASLSGLDALQEGRRTRRCKVRRVFRHKDRDLWRGVDPGWSRE